MNNQNKSLNFENLKDKVEGSPDLNKFLLKLDKPLLLVRNRDYLTEEIVGNYDRFIIAIPRPVITSESSAGERIENKRGEGLTDKAIRNLGNFGSYKAKPGIITNENGKSTSYVEIVRI